MPQEKEGQKGYGTWLVAGLVFLLIVVLLAVFIYQTTKVGEKGEPVTQTDAKRLESRVNTMWTILWFLIILTLLSWVAGLAGFYFLKQKGDSTLAGVKGAVATAMSQGKAT